MRNPVKNSQHKIDEANKKLASQKNPPKDWTVSEPLKTKPNFELNSNSNNKKLQQNPSQKFHLNSTRTSNINSNPTSNSNEKDVTNIQSSSWNIILKGKKKKRQQMI